MLGKILFSLFLAFFSSLNTFATTGDIDPMNLPKFEHFINDYSEVLSSEKKQELESRAKDYETKTTNQVVVTLFGERKGNELIDIGLKAFRENGIGQKDKNNGILLLIATDEKKIRIITGYGLEGDIPDVLASDIIEKDIRPLVNSGSFDLAIGRFYDRIFAAIGTDEGKNLKKASEEPPFILIVLTSLGFGAAFGWNIYFLAFAGIIFIMISIASGSILPIILYCSGALLILIIWHFLSPASLKKTFFEFPQSSGGGGSSSGGFSGGGGGGGFSGGGGSSGGGGAGD